MTCQEQQEEELEVLLSIYEGDDNFKQVSPTTFQYKYGEDGSYRAFNVELVWREDYPETEPLVNVDTFYNKHIFEEVKRKIMEKIQEQVPDLLGCAMTYTLFELVKENYDDVIAEQPETQPVNQVSNDEKCSVPEVAKKKEKKEQLTKNQKRKLFDRLDATGEKPRGWDWVDVIRHLSQSGSQNG
ncbi:RWD domain-containing protein 4-like [Ostrea edulis]|uniref:RWD domain-containing protein 4-like n=1 Tax=Ostrea edulis TaxID=37623 RepID=UPI0024AEB744|nr:RWD domain-containing protein 4-like [Ostrea edulis]